MPTNSHAPELDGPSSDRRGRSAVASGAWAAAAVVLGLGGLGFGAAAQYRVSALEDRVAQLESTARAPRRQTQVAGVSVTTSPRVSTTAFPAAPVAPSTSRELSSPSTTRPESSPSSVVPAIATPGPPLSPAETAVRRAFDVVYDGSRSAASRTASIDDAVGLLATFDRGERDPDARSARSLRATVRAVEFSSPTRATVTYALDIGSGIGPDRTGEARVAGGTWKVTRSTVCGDLALVAMSCVG